MPVVNMKTVVALSALPFSPPRGLPAGQITVRGVYLQGGGSPVGEKKFAITGGTEDYGEARAQLTEDGANRILDVGAFVG